MNYFSKNLKTLRSKNGFSQEQFARLFGLSKSNINSYENGAFPKIEMYIQIMDYFEFDPSKFLKLDMEQHSVSRAKNASNEEKDAEALSETLDNWVKGSEPDKLQFQFLENLTNDEIKALYIKQYRAKEEILKENLELKAKYIKLLEGK